MAITSDKQPLCRCCGKKLKRTTVLHEFGIPDGSRRDAWAPRPHAQDAATRAEAQRYLNQEIVSSKTSYTGNLIVATWDGESYRSEQEFFCTLRCAARYGRFGVIHAPQLMTQKYADALVQADATDSGEA